MTIKLDAHETLLREDKRNGLAVVMRGEGISPLCLVKGVYDAALKCWKPDYDLGLHLSDFRSWPTRKDALDFAEKLRWPKNKITHLGTRFSRGYGLRWDERYPYFLSIDWDDEKVRKVVCAHRTTHELFLREIYDGPDW